ncbi:MAG: hypothetical protein GX172_00545 [Clostridiales bacterium]|nr:hypothetical protein [Clostridiales bacterium]
MFLAGTSAGLMGFLSLHRRVTSFEQMERLVSFIETQIRYSGAPVYEILQKASKSDFGKLKFLQKAADLIRGGLKPDIAWESAINLYCDDVGFTADDRGLVFDFGKGLGSSDTEGQLRHCETYRRLFSDRLKRARTDAQYKGRLYITLGICGGLGAALLML